LTTFDPVSLMIALALLALVPTLIIVSTCFLKIAVVMFLVRNAVGVQQIPPNLALYGLALILSAYIMAPVGQNIYQKVTTTPSATQSVQGLVTTVGAASEPMRDFLYKHSQRRHRDFFVRTAKDLWGPELSAQVTDRDFIVVLPAFMISELSQAFEIGFLLFLPFVVIDIVVSNILLAMGMMMVSPTMISMPLKLFLFVMVDGWTRLIRGLILTYT
jgi:type III secretion protein R